MKPLHYGFWIKQARERLGMTQAELAALWPRDDGGRGVSVGFVQCVESGKKAVHSDRTRRGLCTILQIEPWRFGLSDIDPLDPSWTPQSKRLLDQTLDFAEHVIQRFEQAYRSAPLPEAAADARKLHQLFEYIKDHQPPSVQQEKRFLKLYAQSLVLDAVIFIGYEEYGKALQSFEEMYEVAEELGEATWLAHALVGIGVELHRQAYWRKHAGDPSWASLLRTALLHLEQARDYTFQTSKPVAAYVHAYLARLYSSMGDSNRFERAIQTALNLAPPSYGDGTDFVYHRLGGILAEQSYGCLELGQPGKTLALRQEIERQIERDRDQRLEAWIHLDWARAFLMSRELEASIAEGRTFVQRAMRVQSPQMQTRARRFVAQLRQAYPDVGGVRQLEEELRGGEATHD